MLNCSLCCAIELNLSSRGGPLRRPLSRFRGSSASLLLARPQNIDGQRRPPSNGWHSEPVSRHEACATDCLIELLRTFFCEVEYCQSSENGLVPLLLASRRGSR